MLLRKSFEIGGNINWVSGVGVGKEELYAHMPSQIGNVVMA